MYRPDYGGQQRGIHIQRGLEVEGLTGGAGGAGEDTKWRILRIRGLVEENQQKPEAGRTNHGAENNRYMARAQMLTRSLHLEQIQSAI